MAPKKKAVSASKPDPGDVVTSISAKRKNIPPAGLEAQGVLRKEPRILATPLGVDDGVANEYLLAGQIGGGAIDDGSKALFFNLHDLPRSGPPPWCSWAVAVACAIDFAKSRVSAARASQVPPYISAPAPLKYTLPSPTWDSVMEACMSLRLCQTLTQVYFAAACRPF